jgi:hypothetical protein
VGAGWQYTEFFAVETRFQSSQPKLDEPTRRHVGQAQLGVVFRF